MKPSHRAMFNRAFERHYSDYVGAGLSHHDAEELAADKAWQDYEAYCDQKLEEKKEEQFGK